MKSLLSKFKSPGKQKKPAAMEAVAAAAAAAAIAGATDELSLTPEPQPPPAPLPSSGSVPASVSPPTVQAAAPMAASSAPAQAQGRTVLLQQCLDEIEALGHEHVDLLQNMCVEALMPPVRHRTSRLAALCSAVRNTAPLPLSSGAHAIGTPQDQQTYCPIRQ